MPTIQPMSLGEYYGAGAGTGVGGAVNNMGDLASTLAQGPMRAAQGAYMGAQTAHAQAQTRDLVTEQQDSARAAEIMRDPQTYVPVSQGQPPNPNVAELASLFIKHPAHAVQNAQGLVNAFTMMAATSGGNMSVPSNLAAGMGVAPMGNTPTGFAADLANRRQVAGISAGPAYAQVNLNRDIFNRTPIEATDATGNNVLTPRSNVIAGGYSPYSATADASNRTLIPGLLPTGRPGYATPTTPGFQPPPTPDSQLALLMGAGGGQGGISGNGPMSLVPTAANPAPTPPSSGAPATSQGQSTPSQPSLAGPPRAGAPGSPGTIPTTGNPYADAYARNRFGQNSVVPPPKDRSAKEMDDMITASLAKNLITPDQKTGLFPVDAKNLQMDPQVRAAILARVNELSHSDDPLYKNQPDVAIERAIQDLKPSLTLDAAHTLNPFNRNAVAALPTIRWTPAAPGTGQNPATVAPPASATPSLTSTITPGPRAAVAPAPSQPGQLPPAQVIAQAKAAIAQGRDPKIIAQRLQAMGIDPSVLAGP